MPPPLPLASPESCCDCCRSCTLPSPPSAFPWHLGGPSLLGAGGRGAGDGPVSPVGRRKGCSLPAASSDRGEAPSISRTMRLIRHVQVHFVKNTYSCCFERVFFEARLKGLIIFGWIVLPLIAVSCLPELIRLMSCWIRGKKSLGQTNTCF